MHACPYRFVWAFEMGQKTAEALQDVNLTERLAGFAGPMVLMPTKI